MSNTVRLLNIAGMGPIIAVIQGEAVDRFVVTNPLQLGTDSTGEIVLCDYLELITVAEKPVEFFKSSVISISEANPALVSAYVESLAAIEKENSAPKLIVPNQKIITN